jgi:AcrR family transcriptional regulator
MSTAETSTDGTSANTWRNQAVARSVDPAREAAEDRVQRLIDAALELMSDPDAGDPTVQNVAERAGLSLRAFYHHFPSKDDLLLAVFEEAIQTTTRSLDQEVAASADPLVRLRIFTTEYYRTCRTGRTEHSDQRLPGRHLGQFAYQLLFDHPQEAAHAFAPLVSSLRRLLDDAAAADAIRPGRDHEQVAGIVLQSIMFNGFATTITGSTTDDYAARGDLFWELLSHGLAGDAEIDRDRP